VNWNKKNSLKDKLEMQQAHSVFLGFELALSMAVETAENSAINKNVISTIIRIQGMENEMRNIVP
jgi:hypothetical protein